MKKIKCKKCGKEIKATTTKQLLYLIKTHNFWKHSMDIDEVIIEDDRAK